MKIDIEPESIAAEVSQIVEKADEYAELVRALIEITKGIRSKMPVQEVADEIRAIFGKDLKPVWSIFVDAAKHLQSVGVMFRAGLVRQVMDTHRLSESTALALVNREAANFERMLKSVELNKGKSKNELEDDNQVS